MALEPPAVADPCQPLIQVPEDSEDCRAAGVQMRQSRLRWQSHFYTSASNAHFRTPVVCGGALKNRWNGTFWRTSKSWQELSVAVLGKSDGWKHSLLLFQKFTTLFDSCLESYVNDSSYPAFLYILLSSQFFFSKVVLSNSSPGSLKVFTFDVGCFSHSFSLKSLYITFQNVC